MSKIDQKRYIAFGYSFLVGLISFSLADELRNPKIFKRCLTAGIASIAIGIALELTNTLRMDKGMALLIMSISIIYLGYYQALRVLFKLWKGTDPYVTSSSSVISGIPIDGFWTKHPKNRKIMWTDFLFSFAHALIPIFTIMWLMILIVKMNK